MLATSTANEETVTHSAAHCSVRRREVAEPVAAYGPAGSTGEQNLSVICAPIRPDFALSSLGTAQEAAQTFLDKNVAPPGSQLQARLLQASER